MKFYATTDSGEKVYFSSIDELFDYVNINTKATGGWVGW
jgi:hypothetical protein